MILDERNEFCDATALNTGGAGSYLLGDVMDLEAAGMDLNGGADTDLYLVIQVDTAATSGGSATARFILASDAQAAIATDGTATVHFDTGAIAVATLVAGYTVCRVAVPAGNPAYERFLGILQTTAAAAFTAGKINAFLTRNPGIYKSYANAAGA